MLRIAFLLACIVGPVSAQVTFSGQIAAIVYRRCAPCHRPGGVAPFSLLTYSDVAKRGQLIANVTAKRIMPPWLAEPASYPYRNSRRLTNEELAAIQTWVRDGMPEGDPAEEPSPPTFSDGWQLGTPDLVIQMPQTFAIPADGPDIYRTGHVPLNLPRDTWLRGFEIRASAPKVIHHLLFHLAPAEEARRVMAEQAKGNFGMRLTPHMVSLDGYSPGAQPDALPPGLAWDVPGGTDILIDCHFHPIGKPETERFTVALYFTKKRPEHSLMFIRLPVAFGFFGDIDIAPGQKDFKIRDSYVLPVDVEAVSVACHAHYLGKTCRMTATLPDGRRKTLLDIRNWNFAWQIHYFFQNPVVLPKGTVIESTVGWDNSAANPYNPSHPPVRVRWGQRTTDEMGAITVLITPVHESDLAALKSSYDAHVREIATAAIQHDPSLLLELRQWFGQ